MDLIQLKRMVRGGEGDRVEFKKKINHPEKVVREVVAFANSTGGHLLIGIDDNGAIDGLSFPGEEEFAMTKAIEELCRPAISFQVETIPVTEVKSVLHYEIFGGQAKPYYAFLNKNHRLGRAYIRVQDKSVQASRELRKTLQKERSTEVQGFQYDEAARILVKHLGSHDHITLGEFCKLSNLPTKQASDIVVNLAQNHVIKILPREEEDWYVFSE